MRPIFDEALMHGISLLRALPRGREESAEAQAQLEYFRAVHPDIRADLLVDKPPACLTVDYDLLLEHPDGGTVAITWCADDGVPWSVQYADHWAANYVATVNTDHITVQQALLFLRFAGHQDPDLMTQLLDQQLIVQTVREASSPVSATELQAAADEFRIASGLYGAEATHRWLEEIGLSVAGFEELLCGTIQARKLKDRVTEDRMEPFFEAHRESFDLIQFLRVETPVEAVAANLARKAQEQSLIATLHTNVAGIEGKDCEAVLRTRYACELSSVLASANFGEVVGPVAESGRYWVAAVLDRQPARLDTQTRVAIQEKLFREWLTEQRKQATVRWHWL